MIVRRDYPCPYKKELNNPPDNLEEDVVFYYTDDKAVFKGIWEYVDDMCSSMAHGPCCHVLSNIVFSEPRGNDYKIYPILVNNRKKEIQVSKIIYDDLKTLRNETIQVQQKKIKISNAIQLLEV